MHRSPHRSLRRSILWLFPILWLMVAWDDCGSGDDDDDTSASFSIEGIWNADLNYLTQNGMPYAYQSWANFRFDPSDEGWKCLVNGLPASECVFTGSAESFHVTATSSSQGSTYTRVRTVDVVGMNHTDDKTLETTFTMDTLYIYDDGTTETRLHTGTGRLVRVDPIDPAPAEGLRLVGDYGGFDGPVSRTSTTHDDAMPGFGLDEPGVYIPATANVRVLGDYAFLARFYDGLRVLDISDPVMIQEVAHAPVTDVGAKYYNDVKLFSTSGRDYAVLSDEQVGLVVYDVTDPYLPTVVSTFFPGLQEEGDLLNNHTVYMEGTTAYLGNYGMSRALDPSGNNSGGLLIVDLADPARPKEVGRWLASELGGAIVHDLYIEDGIAYLCCWEIGLVVMDVRDPANLRILGRFTYDRMKSHSVWVTSFNGRKIAVHGDEDFGAHVRIVDVDPASPEFMTQLSEFQLRPEVSVHNIVAVGHEAIAAWYQDGIRVLDLSNPYQPKQVAYYNTWDGPSNPVCGHSFFEGGIGVEVVGDRIYLADIYKGLLILERE